MTNKSRDSGSTSAAIPHSKRRAIVKSIVAGFGRQQMTDYRRLRRNARIMGRVLVYDPAPAGYDWEMLLITPREADEPEMLGRRIVLYWPPGVSAR
jgi:hypothetical protein